MRRLFPLGSLAIAGCLFVLCLLLVPPVPAFADCTCSGGTEYWGRSIPPSETYCGYTACGTDNRVHRCEQGNAWRAIDPGPCNNDRGCRCAGGSDIWGNQIPPERTFCGMRVCGGDNQYYECTSGGWAARGGAPCSTKNDQGGLNTADWLWSSAGEVTDQNTSQRNGLGYYLMMLGRPGTAEWNEIGFKVLPAIQQAHARNLTPILRLCTHNDCTFQNPQRLLDLVENPSLYGNVSEVFYVIAGPNEPPTEKWVDPSVSGMTPACGIQYCNGQIDAIAREIAEWSAYVVNNIHPDRRLHHGGNVGLLSPVFDCHHPNTPYLVQRLDAELEARNVSFRAFDGIGINAYDLNGSLATAHVETCKQIFQNVTGSRDYDFFLTETGMLEIDQNGVSRNQALINLNNSLALFQADGNVKAALIFNGTGRNGSGAFAYNVLPDDSHWSYLYDDGGTGSTACSCAVPDNFCQHQPWTNGCPMTLPGGYCDRNENSSYDDADWTTGWVHFQSDCP